LVLLAAIKASKHSIISGAALDVAKRIWFLHPKEYDFWLLYMRKGLAKKEIQSTSPRKNISTLQSRPLKYSSKFQFKFSYLFVNKQKWPRVIELLSLHLSTNSSKQKAYSVVLKHCIVMSMLMQYTLSVYFKQMTLI
jgi:hypothetical protein